LPADSVPLPSVNVLALITAVQPDIGPTTGTSFPQAISQLTWTLPSPAVKANLSKAPRPSEPVLGPSLAVGIAIVRPSSPSPHSPSLHLITNLLPRANHSTAQVPWRLLNAMYSHCHDRMARRPIHLSSVAHQSLWLWPVLEVHARCHPYMPRSPATPLL
jgi:hypothetical protein